jgi:hypothetical protein
MYVDRLAYPVHTSYLYSICGTVSTAELLTLNETKENGCVWWNWKDEVVTMVKAIFKIY